MKMPLRFTAGALLALTIQAVCFAQTLHANQYGFQYVRSGPGLPTISWSIRGVLSRSFQQPVVDF